MKISLFFLPLFIAFASVSQTRYTVFKTVGEISYFSAKSKQWEKLKAKDSVNSNTKIKFNPNSSLVIFDSKFHIYELRQEGEFLLKNTFNAKAANTSPEMQKAVKFFVEQTFAGNSSGNTQKVKGAIYRGKEVVFPWDSTDIVEDTFNVVVKLSRESYPVMVSLNGYKALIYNDTILRLSRQYIIGEDYNKLTIGKYVINIRKRQDKVARNGSSILSVKSLSVPMKYTLLIGYCISKQYYTQAKFYLEQLKNEDIESYNAVKENLRENNNFNAMVAI